MNSLPSNEPIGTELQHEMTDWIADELSDSEAHTSFDEVVVDEFDFPQNDQNGDGESLGNPLGAREGDSRPLVHFDLDQNTVHHYDPEMESVASEGDAQLAERSPTMPLIGQRKSKRLPTPSSKLMNSKKC